MKSQAFGFLLAACLSGCTGNVKEVSCSGEDWEKLGYQTGQSGKSVRTFDAYRNGCGDNLEIGAMNLYLDGYTRGIVEFCTYENGYEIGLKNRDLPDVCPTELKSAFAKGHAVGVFEFRQKLSDVNRITEDENMKQSADRANDSPKIK